MAILGPSTGSLQASLHDTQSLCHTLRRQNKISLFHRHLPPCTAKTPTGQGSRQARTSNRRAAQGRSKLVQWLTEDIPPPSPRLLVTPSATPCAPAEDLPSPTYATSGADLATTAVDNDSVTSTLVASVHQHDTPDNRIASHAEATTSSQPPQPALGPISGRKLWFMAIKPPMYTVALIPILVSAAAAYADYGLLRGALFGQLVIGAFCIIAWLNTSNDFFDSFMGVDGIKVESLVNMTGNPWGCFAVANLFLAAGLTLLGRAVWHAADARAGAALGAAIVGGYLYQGPPFRLSYKGLGEPLCFITFGPLATCALYLIQAVHSTGGIPVKLTSSMLTCSMLVGITTAAILFCSHFHQIEGDRAALKMSPLVRLGSTARGYEVLKAGVLSVYALTASALLLGVLPVTVLPFMLLSLPQARSMLSFCAQNLLDPKKVKPLKIYATKWHTAFGAMLAAGLVAPQLVSQHVVGF